ncbi:hypothetical protein Pla52o_56000 [Novipirellula galeiformis]|uniref:Uncharacterized protein n=1 Tax=Novipirellula galeiformis TaxID=2528004 RepID=A0A5C6BHH3_9BACT|nr:hypothetical protein [Novipirellula galeiformis]TWU11162.1 hypothetical protein Pla52o_56000 [Novipirellula galeiformis]
MHYLLGAKPGDHKYLFDQVIDEMSTVAWLTRWPPETITQLFLCLC